MFSLKKFFAMQLEKKQAIELKNKDKIYQSGQSFPLQLRMNLLKPGQPFLPKHYLLDSIFKSSLKGTGFELRTFG